MPPNCSLHQALRLTTQGHRKDTSNFKKPGTTAFRRKPCCYPDIAGLKPERENKKLSSDAITAESSRMQTTHTRLHAQECPRRPWAVSEVPAHPRLKGGTDVARLSRNTPIPGLQSGTCHQLRDTGKGQRSRPATPRPAALTTLRRAFRDRARRGPGESARKARLNRAGARSPTASTQGRPPDSAGARSGAQGLERAGAGSPATGERPGPP